MKEMGSDKQMHWSIYIYKTKATYYSTSITVPAVGSTDNSITGSM